MKKTLLALLTIVLFVTFACQPAQNTNTRVDNTANSNTASVDSEDEFTFMASDESPQRCRNNAADEKLVVIVISNADLNGCRFEDPGEIEVSIKANEKVRWCVINECSVSPVQVMIDSFVNVANANDKNPFGGREDRDNIFFTNPIRSTKAKHIVSKVPHNNTVKNRYKYYIKLFGPSGEWLYSLDPHVVISDS